MTPSLRSVRLFRFWTAVGARSIGVVLLVYLLPGWFSEIAGGVVNGDPLSAPRYNSAWWGTSLGLLLASALVFGADWLARFIVPMPRAGCPGCGYSIKDNPVRCPECGLPLGENAA